MSSLPFWFVGLWFGFKIYFVFIYEYICVCVRMSAPDVQMGRKTEEGIKSLELEVKSHLT